MMDIDLTKLYKEEYSVSTSKLILKSNKNFSEKALFIDRDGVLIEDVHHINSPDKVFLCSKVKNFLIAAKQECYDIVVITNQSSVSRKIISYDEYINITTKFLSLLPKDIYPDLILSSFHLPNNENNLRDFNWRKPDTGMIDYAIKLGKYNRFKSVIVGDKLTDLISGYKSGISNIIYVKSNLHKDQFPIVEKWAMNNKISYKQIDILDPTIIKNIEIN